MRILDFGIHRFVILFIAIGCGSSASDAPGGGAPDGGGGGGGGDPGQGGEACSYDGEENLDVTCCDTITIQLSEPIPRAEIGVHIETSHSGSFDEIGGPVCDIAVPVIVFADGDPVDTLRLSTPSVPVPDLQPLSVEVTKNGSVVASQNFDQLAVSCVKLANGEVCRNADPVDLEVSSEGASGP